MNKRDNRPVTKCAVRAKKAKKIIAAIFPAMIVATIATVSAAAVDTSAFISTAQTALTLVVSLIGAGLGIWGVVNLLEGYGSDNPGSKSQGMKQLVAGVGLILVGTMLVPVLFKMMS